MFSDGEAVCAALDRNGLRPARYMVLRDAQGKQAVHVMSEVGVTKALEQFQSDVEATANAAGSAGGGLNSFRIIDSGRLGPGEMIAVDLGKKKMLLNDELKAGVAARQPYARWNAQSIQVGLNPNPNPNPYPNPNPTNLTLTVILTTLTRTPPRP